LGERCVDDRLPLFLCENTLNAAGRPQDHHPIEEAHRVGTALEIRAQEREAILYLGADRVIAGCRADGDCRQSRSEVWRSVSLPRLVVKVEPRPRTFQLAVAKLERPKIVERLSRIGCER